MGGECIFDIEIHISRFDTQMLHNNNERSITMNLFDVLFGAYTASAILEDEYDAQYEEVIERYEDKIDELEEQIELLSEKNDNLESDIGDEDY